jgi:anti-repressor protein
MDKELMLFKSNEFGEIRVAELNSEPMFCLSDVCKSLNLNQSSRVKERLSLDGVTQIKVIDSLGREQFANFINEKFLKSK